MLPCAYCKKEFVPRHKRARFCSLRCQRAFRINPNPTPEDLVKLSIKLLNLTCPQCHASFLQTRPNQIYCSQSCRTAYFYSTKTKPKIEKEKRGKKLNISERWQTIVVESEELWEQIQRDLA
jgi:hypothetical protein